MSRSRSVQPATLVQAVERFKREFTRRYPASRFLIDGEGYEDEDLDLDIFVDGDQVELEQHASEVSLRVQASTGYFILPFVVTEADTVLPGR